MFILLKNKSLPSTVGRDEQKIRNYIRHQEKEDMKLDKLSLF